jgi:hypothetical protein
MDPGAKKETEDILLASYRSYWISQNGDNQKRKEIYLTAICSFEGVITLGTFV